MVLGSAAAMVAGLAARRPASQRPDLSPPVEAKDYPLIFADDFDTLDIGEAGRRWAPRLWYEQPPPPDHFSAADSVLTLRCFRRGGKWTGCNLATEWTDTRGGTFFRGGYFEARMKVPRAWPAFWLFSVNHSRNIRPDPKDPTTLCAEIDIFEGDSAHPDYFCGALHRNTGGGGGISDDFNHNNCQDAGVDLTRDWHLYSVLWTRREIVWYLDRRETHRAPTFDSTPQDAFLILGLGAGGVLGGPPPGAGIDEIALQVDWVRVWSRLRE